MADLRKSVKDNKNNTIVNITSKTPQFGINAVALDYVVTQFSIPLSTKLSNTWNHKQYCSRWRSVWCIV